MEGVAFQYSFWFEIIPWDSNEQVTKSLWTKLLTFTKLWFLPEKLIPFLLYFSHLKLWEEMVFSTHVAALTFISHTYPVELP